MSCISPSHASHDLAMPSLGSKIHQEVGFGLSLSHLHDEVMLLGLICNKVGLVEIIVHMP